MNGSNKVEKRKEKDEGWEMGKEFWDRERASEEEKRKTWIECLRKTLKLEKCSSWVCWTRQS